MRNKKGNAIIEGMTILVVFFAMAIFSIIGYGFFDDLNTDIQNDDSLTQQAKDTSKDVFSKYPSLMDNLFLFAFILIVIVMLALVFMIDTHPIFFIIAVVLLGGLFVVGMALSNTYDDLMSDSTFSADAYNFPFTNWIMTHFVELIIAIGFMITLVLFIKFQG